ncbi:HalOD1 output domain-containing protein [Natronobacterium gregoryi]|uniref:Halobacterial output domain-containing protein n=2 Tax=Natronobacterium gregoryi TaxID=44930 RepID=L0AEM7_NATGS|nr:HalOD1 output domain-containing protein [Natronobacterium gregoryi]AFZ72363.1 hypothetical protein Natgr_1136 [Natronobacterium gregoryi SP2]ELY64252.1 hypothetical protein C490_14725 [Natronobacterium gregoryi SP2]PLK20322.1 hypothetical protein CYV19_10185 [Natronobacterium gregoryi SP2]SFJ22326.1 hypothetical protein SAMN05443661_11834 [Natronobacterium gregoryi]
MTDGGIYESDGRTCRRRVRYDRTEGESASIAVATALARYHDEDATDPSTRLYDYVDPEALDALVAGTEDGARSASVVEFEVERTAVRVYPGHVEVSATG